MKIGLVAVIVVALQAGEGIYLLAAAEYAFARYYERTVESRIELVAAHKLDQTVDVVRHIVGVLDCIALLKAHPRSIRVEVGYKITLFIARTHEFRTVIKELAPSFRQAGEKPVVIVTSELTGHLSHGIRAEAVFKSVRCGEARTARSGLHMQLGGVRRIAAGHKLTYIELAGTGRTSLAANLVFNGGLITQLDIKVAYAYIVSGGNGQAGEIRTYTRHIFAARYAVAEPSRILIDKELA